MPAPTSTAPHGQGDQEYLRVGFAGTWTPGERRARECLRAAARRQPQRRVRVSILLRPHKLAPRCQPVYGGRWEHAGSPL